MKLKLTKKIKWNKEFFFDQLQINNLRQFVEIWKAEWFCHKKHIIMYSAGRLWKAFNALGFWPHCALVEAFQYSSVYLFEERTPFEWKLGNTPFDTKTIIEVTEVIKKTEESSNWWPLKYFFSKEHHCLVVVLFVLDFGVRFSPFFVYSFKRYLARSRMLIYQYTHRCHTLFTIRLFVSFHAPISATPSVQNNIFLYFFVHTQQAGKIPSQRRWKSQNIYGKNFFMINCEFSLKSFDMITFFFLRRSSYNAKNLEYSFFGTTDADWWSYSANFSVNFDNPRSWFMHGLVAHNLIKFFERRSFLSLPY